jgi:hypothetical protein
MPVELAQARPDACDSFCSFHRHRGIDVFRSALALVVLILFAHSINAQPTPPTKASPTSKATRKTPSDSTPTTATTSKVTTKDTSATTATTTLNTSTNPTQTSPTLSPEQEAAAVAAAGGMGILGILCIAGACLLGLLVYLIPTLVAFGRSHPNAAAICAVNLLLGWLFIGWVVALVWSFTAIDQDRRYR